jgi:hypothetical protein
VPVRHEPQGKDVVLVVGTDGKSHKIPHMEDMVRQNRQQYAETHGYPSPFSFPEGNVRLRNHVGKFFHGTKSRMHIRSGVKSPF